MGSLHALTTWRAPRRSWRRLLSLTIVPAMMAVAPAHAFLVSGQTAAPSPPTGVGLTIPALEASPLEQKVQAGMVAVQAKRPAAAQAPLEVSQLLWLVALLTSMCGFTLYLGRELSTGFPGAVRQGSNRRA